MVAAGAAAGAALRAALFCAETEPVTQAMMARLAVAISALRVCMVFSPEIFLKWETTLLS